MFTWSVRCLGGEREKVVSAGLSSRGHIQPLPHHLGLTSIAASIVVAALKSQKETKA